MSSLDWLISIGLLPVSFALTGPVSAAIGAQATLIGAGVIGGVITFAALFIPGMRAIERPRPPAAVAREARPLARSLRRVADATAAALASNPSDPALRRDLARLLELRLWLNAQDLADWPRQPSSTLPVGASGADT